MSYISERLLKNEKILYQGSRHWAVFFLPLFWLVVTIVFSYKYPFLRNLSFLTVAITVVTGVAAFISYTMSEIGVTNMRIIIKVGLFSVSSTETMLQNIASIDVEQSLCGRILGYGTIIIFDKGTVRIPFTTIEDPYGFRRRTQEEIDKRYPAPSPAKEETKETEENGQKA